jgi:hypothetical protein
MQRPGYLTDVAGNYKFECSFVIVVLCKGFIYLRFIDDLGYLWNQKPQVTHSPSSLFFLSALFCIYSRNQFVMEYCGEVMNYRDFQNRAEQYDRQKRTHYYFMTLRADEVS